VESGGGHEPHEECDAEQVRDDEAAGARQHPGVAEANIGEVNAQAPIELVVGDAQIAVQQDGHHGQDGREDAEGFSPGERSAPGLAYVAGLLPLLVGYCHRRLCLSMGWRGILPERGERGHAAPGL
jgi:hypothetical protein